FHIYQYLLQNQETPVTVLNIAEKFDIHPNVARLHLSKLEEIDVVTSYYEKTGRGGRPSKLYQLSDNVIELNFPHRDYKLLSSIAIDTLADLGYVGKKALYKTGSKYCKTTINRSLHNTSPRVLTVDQKIHLLEEASTMLRMYPDFIYDEATK